MAPPKHPRTPRECPICQTIYEPDPWDIARGKQTTCSKPCSYALRMQTRRCPQDKTRKSAEHQRVRKLRKDAAYRARHRQALNRKASEYARTHPEIKADAQHRRRARRNGAAINDLTRSQWRAIKAAFGNRCAYCGEHFERLTMDHVISLSKGGGHTASNVVPACRPCNTPKYTKHMVPAFLPEDSDYLVHI